MCMWSEKYKQLQFWIMRNKAWSLCTVFVLSLCIGGIVFSLSTLTNAALIQDGGLGGGRFESFIKSGACAGAYPFTQAQDKGRRNGSVFDFDTLALTELWSQCLEQDRSLEECGKKEEVEEEGKQWSGRNRLQVFLVPHSHNDAGWLRTFEDYYETTTKNILDNMLDYLPQNPDMRFTWAEISFFNLWWKELDDNKRFVVKTLVENKQLEFIGGGWIMSDEASTHYVSYLTQMIEGHQWLQQHFNYTPTRAWSIDPFGLSSSFAFLNRGIGFRSSVITRTHYALKKLLGDEKSFEFLWRQSWDTDGEAEIFTHMMPSTTYDTADTCGPDHYICTKFSEEMLGEKPFNVTNRALVQQRSMMLLDQFRKKSVQFATNNILIPIGGDFKWSKEQDWTEGLKYMRTIMDYINSMDNLYTDVRIATLEDYFQALESEMQAKTFTPKVLTGDFFTYADRYSDYWSGYFTSRIFHKSTERQLLGVLRGAQISFTLVTAEVYRKMGTLMYQFIDTMFEKISECRRTLSLFQHHDGITGTSKDHVVSDYARKLDDAIRNCYFVMQQSLTLLSNMDRINEIDFSRAPTNDSILQPLKYRRHAKELWLSHLFQVPERSKTLLTVFNPLTESKMELIRVNVSTPNVKVVDLDGQEIPSEIHPMFRYVRRFRGNPARLEFLSNQFQLLFVAPFKPLEIRSFVLRSTLRNEEPVDVEILNTETKIGIELSDNFRVSSGRSSRDSEIEVSNENLKLHFNSYGELVATTQDNRVTSMNLTYHHYTTYSSGVYLFFPNGRAKPIEIRDPVIVVVHGKMESYVQSYYDTVHQRISLTNDLGLDSHAISVDLTLDVRKEYNYELIMRLGTELRTDGLFYTDSNAFQMEKRKYLSGLPISGNYYPLASSAFIEDQESRITVVAAQPGGVSSLKTGQLEIMLDRILNQDDGRGVGQDGTDNLKTLSRFKILMERTSCGSPENEPPRDLNPRLSLEAHHHLKDLLNPLIPFYKANTSSQDVDDVSDYFIRDSRQLPCDVEVSSVYPLVLNSCAGLGCPPSSLGNKYEIGSLFHRIGFDPRFGTQNLLKRCNLLDYGHFKLMDIFGGIVSSVVEKVSLNLVHSQESFSREDVIRMRPMEVQSFKTQFQRYQ